MNSGASYFLPTENQWYKAAYYSPNYGGTGVGGYWTYATQSNTDPGATIGSSANQANYDSAIGTATNVGSFIGSGSFYGTFDQTGNVREWNDQIIFLRKIQPGPADKSYGIQVARLAGMPPAVVQRAREILGGLEAGSGLPAKASAASAQVPGSVTPKKAPPAKPAGKEAGPELDLFA